MKSLLSPESKSVILFYRECGGINPTESSVPRLNFRIITLSYFFFQASSLWLMSSIQCDRVAIIPAVVALNVIASPLKSIA